MPFTMTEQRVQAAEDSEKATDESGTMMDKAPKMEEAEDGAEVLAPPRQIESSSESFQYILQSVGGYGKWQWKLFFVTSFCGIFTAFHNLSAGMFLFYFYHYDTF